MSIVKEYIEKGGGNYLTVKNCNMGDKFTIETITLDDETFDKAYIVLTGKLDRTGDDASVRLGVQNLKRIAEALGEDETKWPGKKLICIGHQEYPGLGQKGLLWSGDVAGASVIAAAPADAEVKAVSDVIGKIMVSNPEMTAAAVKKLIDAEVEKAAGLLTLEAGARIVASNLGVDIS